MISSKDLSFVVVGNVNDPNTDIALNSIKEFYPDSEVILSTVVPPNRDIDIDFTIAVNKDPGELIDTINGHEANKNLNRLIVNSQVGCWAATRNYVVRTRNDIVFNSDSLISFYEKFKALDRPPSQKTVVLDKIMIGDIWTMHPFSPNGLSYHPSDWVMMSTKESLLEYYSIPLKASNEISDGESKLFHRNEQYQFLSNIWKHTTRDLVNIKYDVDVSQARQAFSYLVQNFFISTRYELGFDSVKYPNLGPSSIWSYSNYQDFISNGW